MKKVKVGNEVSMNFATLPYEQFKFGATVEIEDAFEDGVDTPEAVAELTEQVQSALADQINVHAQTLLVLTESKKAYFKKALKAKQGRN